MGCSQRASSTDQKVALPTSEIAEGVNPPRQAHIVKSDITANLYCSFEELAGLQEQWDDLAESVGSGIFLTYDWCRIWWKYYGGKRDLKVWVFRKGEQLIGIVPLFLENIRLGPVSIRAVRIVGSDHTMAQFSLPVVAGHITDVKENLADSLLMEKWDVIHIGPIAGLCGHYDSLKESVSRAFNDTCDVSYSEDQVQTYFFVADTWDAQLAELSKNARRNIKRKCKALKDVLKDRPGTLTSDFATVQKVNAVFQGFVDMHQKHWNRKGKLGHFGDWPDSFDFHKEMALEQLKHGRLRLMQVRWGQYNLGYEYTYKFGNKYFAFLNSRTDVKEVADVGVGTTIFAERMKKAIGENVKYVDAMRAKYDHKMRLGGKLFPMRDIYVIHKRINSRLRVRFFRLFSRLLHLAYYKIWFMRIAPKLPFRRRPLWRIWIRANAFCQ